MVPELGMGAMDTPNSVDGDLALNAAIDAGITFVDTARDYAGSELLIGRVLRARGGADACLASKTFRRSADGAQWDIDASLRAMGVPRIAVYQLHDLRTDSDWDQAVAPGGALDGLKTAQYRGLIGHIGVSSHNLDIVERAIRSGEFDTVMVEYSAFYPDSAPLIALAADRDVGVILMRPLGGSGRTTTMRGRIADGTAGLITPANLLRYVLSNPGVSVAIPGMSHPSRVDDNVAIAGSYVPMDENERSAVEAEAARFYDEA